jgi:hypothetical protein
MRESLSILACLLLFPQLAISADKTPSNIYGQYFGVKRVCDVSPRHCHKTSDSLTLEKSTYDQLTRIQHIKVVGLFSFDNNNTCEYEGSGLWVNDRILASNNETECEVVLVHSHNQIHTVVTTPDQCRTHCGMHGSLDGAVVTRAKVP